MKKPWPPADAIIYRILFKRRERDTMLAALRLWQSIPRNDKARWLLDVAADNRSGPKAMLTYPEIDALCERIQGNGTC